MRAVGDQQRFVMHRSRYAVQRRCELRRRCGQHQGRTRVQQRLPVGVVDAQFGGEVDAAERRSHHTFHAADLGRAEHPGGGFDQRDHRRNLPRDRRDLRRIGRLRQHDRAGVLPDHRQVLGVPWRADAVDPHHGRPPAAEEFGDVLAGRVLLLDADRVLQVEDDGVGTGGRRLGEAIRPVAGHEQQGAGVVEFGHRNVTFASAITWSGAVRTVRFPSGPPQTSAGSPVNTGRRSR